MCRVIFQMEGFVRRTVVPCDTDSEAAVRAAKIVQLVSGWEFVAFERCVFAADPSDEPYAAKLKAL
jgi:hypothetical protein